MKIELGTKSGRGCYRFAVNSFFKKLFFHVIFISYAMKGIYAIWRCVFAEFDKWTNLGHCSYLFLAYECCEINR